jgi:hypothetical protein
VRRHRFFLDPSLTLEELASYHYDVQAALRFYFAAAEGENSGTLQSRMVESEVRSVLAVLTSLEAHFQIDFNERCRRRMKDGLSFHFRALEKKTRGDRVSLNDILEGWKKHGPVSAGDIGQVRGALTVRHFLAHGRYWFPGRIQKYNFEGVHFLATVVLANFPLNT